MSDLPVYSIAKVISLRDRLITEVFYPRYQVEMQGVVFDSLVRDLAQQLPKSISFDRVYETARQLLGQTLTVDLCAQFAWTVAGNLDRMRQGLGVTPWVGQTADEWVPAQLVRMDPGVNARHERGVYVKFVILAGTPAGKSTRRFWRQAMCSPLASRAGFTKPWKDMPYQAPEQMVNMRFMLHLIAEKSQEEPWFHEVQVSPSMRDWNVDLLKRRYKKIRCPNDWKHPCHKCVIGYRDCPAGTHAFTYEMRFCADCGKSSPFDPESASPSCVICTHHQATHPHRT